MFPVLCLKGHQNSFSLSTMAYKKSGYNRHMQKRRLSLLLISSLLFLGTILWACDPVQEPPATEQAPTIELPTVVVSTNTPEVLATATEVPPPISVNGESIPLSYYQNEISVQTGAHLTIIVQYFSIFRANIQGAVSQF